MEQQRELKQVWMAPDTRKGSRYAWHTLGGVIGIMLLAVLLATGGTVLTLYMGLSQEVLLVLCAAVTLLVLWLALRAARRSVREDTLFFLTKTDHLYGIQARMLVKHSGHMLGQTLGAISVQNLLRQMAEQTFVPAEAEEILQVEQIRENRCDYVVQCRVRYPDGHMAKRTYFVVNGIEDKDLLLYQFQRRQGRQGEAGVWEDRNLPGILFSAIALLVLGAVCVASHPALDKLPQILYFPCLGAAFAALCVLVYFVVRQHRGE